MSDKERAKNKADHSPSGILRRNSVRIGEVGLRTLGSVFLMFNYKQVPAAMKLLFKGHGVDAFKTAKTQDPFTFIMGSGYVAGKAMGLLAQTYDPNNPPTTYW